MYGWIWRHLPGGTALRIVLSVLIVAVVVYLLFQYVFPWAEPHMPFGGGGQVGSGSSGGGR